MIEKGRDIPDHEIVLIKRRHGGEDEGHHGGVWKIAYADFMTAMMAFFLVMWLVNAADKKTVTEIANYFNPVKLTDKAPNSKGVQDVTGQEASSPVRGDEGKAKGVSGPGLTPEDTGTGGKDSAIFRDPFGILQQLAEKAMSEAAVKSAPALGSQSDRRVDPFLANPTTSDGVEDIVSGSQNKERAQTLAATINLPTTEQKTPTIKPLDSTSTTAGSVAGDKGKSEGTAAMKQEAKAISDEIDKALKDIAPSDRPAIQTKATPEGVMISITDDLNFSMFSIASAEPNAQLVPIMDKLSDVLNKHKGQITIRGHTDGRQYKSKKYDNWSLSMDRARITYFMLLRGKVDEQRIFRLEGGADRSLRTVDPTAALNRRIEILLKSDQG